MSAILKVLPRPRGRQVNLTSAQECLKLFPSRCRDGRARIYAIAFDGGVVKVGKTERPRSRLRDHWTRGEGEVLWVHMFAPMHVLTANAVERQAPQALGEFLSSIHGSEWFRGDTDKQRVIETIRSCIARCRKEVQASLDASADEKARREKAAALLASAGLHGIVTTYHPHKAFAGGRA